MHQSEATQLHTGLHAAHMKSGTEDRTIRPPGRAEQRFYKQIANPKQITRVSNQVEKKSKASCSPLHSFHLVLGEALGAGLAPSGLLVLPTSPGLGALRGAVCSTLSAVRAIPRRAAVPRQGVQQG